MERAEAVYSYRSMLWKISIPRSSSPFLDPERGDLGSDTTLLLTFLAYLPIFPPETHEKVCKFCRLPQ
jgi:hypothetical protein